MGCTVYNKIMKRKLTPNIILNKIKFGWNLGNYFDSHDKKFRWETSKSKTVEYVVNLWHNPVFNFECFDALKNCNINCVRIPITWCNFIDIEKNDIRVSNEFIEYLKELIDEAFKRDFVVIINMHHDDETWLNVSCSHNEFVRVRKRFKNLWKAIAFIFKDYNENLIFEGMNEIIDRSNPDKYDWIGEDKRCFKRLNLLYRIFVKAVRRFSKNNKQRTLIISTYGAQIHKNAIANFKMPKDSNLVVDLHFYSKSTDEEYYEERFKYVKQFFIEKGIPVIVGEIGVKKDCENTLDVLKVYVDYMKKLNLKCVLWDNGKSRKFIDRENGCLVEEVKSIF